MEYETRDFLVTGSSLGVRFDLTLVSLSVDGEGRSQTGFRTLVAQGEVSGFAD